MKFTRRRLLSVAGVGVASAATFTALSTGSVAYQSSTTVGSEPTIRVDWRETYNGSVVESGGENDGPIFDLGNVLPGDSGTLAFRVTPETEEGGAHATFALELTASTHNTDSEPAAETTADSDIGDAIQTAVWYDTGTFGVEGFGGCDGNRDAAETTLVDGTLRDADIELRDGVPLGGDCLGADQSVCVGIEWSLPASTGNPIQGDSAETRLSFTVEPCELQ